MARRRNYGTFTPARRAALRRAQELSAAKRRGRHQVIGSHVARNKRKYIAGGVVLGTILHHKLSGASLSVGRKSNRSVVNDRQLPGVIGLSRSGNFGTTLSVRYGARKLAITHKTGAQMRKDKAVTTGRKVHVNRDLIPRYEPKSKKSWPYGDEKAVVSRNERERREGLQR